VKKVYYHWARRGDINAFFGLMLDNVAVMVLLFSLISSTTPGQLRFTPGFVLTRMIPGTALGVLLGDLVYTALAFRLARRTGRDDVTAMPLGLDTPSTFGVALLVLLPSLRAGYDLYRDHTRAMEFAWHVGLVVLIFSGVFKLILAPLGNAVRRVVPRAGLLGSLAAIALALIAFLPMIPLPYGIADMPVVGMLALAVILVTLVAHRDLPFRFPGALAAVLLGVLLYWAGRGLGELAGVPIVPPPAAGGPEVSWDPLAMFSFYGAPPGWWAEVVWAALGKLPVALPFALATIVGGIDCTESAAAAGDNYDTRTILLTEGAASLVAGFLGGVIQTTPYIGHPAYKKMGGRAAYTLVNALFVGAAGSFGLFIFLFQYLPPAAMFPILVFVGLEITAQSFHATPVRHYPAVVLAMLPALAALVVVVLKGAFPGVTPPTEGGRLAVQTLRCLANGFLISGMLWAGLLVMILDGKPGRAALYCVVAGLCALVGIIHSPLADERIDWPWAVLGALAGSEYREAVRYQTPYHWAAAYALMAGLLLALGWRREEGAEPGERRGLPPPSSPPG
jgi:adenine/guanine/hypoxanthine permease